MKKPHNNKIDQLISNLSEEFSKIPNFDLTQTDNDANRLFNLIIAKIFDIQDFRILYQNYFIPATNRALADTKKELKKSLYRKALNVSELQLKENYYDTIRLGYVGLFHKMENFVKDLLTEANILFNNGKTGQDSIEDYFNKKYDFKFNNWRTDITADKINWICNCVKHYDGFPKKEPKYRFLSHLPENEKIKIQHTEFYKDIDYIIKTYFHVKLSQIFSLTLFKMSKDEFENNPPTGDLKFKFDELEEKAKLLMTI